VADDCGVAISRDNGATWTHVVPDPSLLLTADRMQNRVWSVLAQSGGWVNIAADDALWFSSDAGDSWTRATTAPFNGQAGVVHAFAPTRFNRRQIFLAARVQFHRSRTFAGAGESLARSIQGGRRRC